jgi:transcriptional regulator with XRE-family HTH domain
MMREIDIEMGNRIQFLMKRRALASRELARDLEVSPSKFFHIINGRAALKPDLAVALAKYFNITLDELFGRAPMPNEITVRTKLPRGYTRETWQAHLQKIVDRIGQQLLDRQIAERANKV